MTDYRLKDGELSCYLWSGRELELRNLNNMVKNGYIKVDSEEYTRLMKLINARCPE